MRLLAIEPYYGGSHRAFLDGWRARSRHDWTLLTFPPYKWKWRMRHAALSAADDVAARVAQGEAWDALFCSDMLNLAELLGLAPQPVRDLPAVVYFHENQLTYPVRHEDERDYHFVFTHISTALAATRVWFNSAFHRDEFLGALPAFLKRMPDHQPHHAVEQIRARSEIRHPGIGPIARGERRDGPMAILWAARWEFDKDPGTFFDALRRLKARRVPFRLNVLGEQFRDSPDVFDHAREEFADEIARWGYQESREDYEAALAESDVVVSTARHEFFGIAVVEAVAAGAYPLLPNRLAYPEIFRLTEEPAAEAFFYGGSAAHLADRLAQAASLRGRGTLWTDDTTRAASAVTRFLWPNHAASLDDAIETLRHE